MKGYGLLFGGAILNSILFRDLRQSSGATPITIDVVCAHPDDELAIYPVLRRAQTNPHVSLNYTLFTNGTQGFESKLHGASREKFGNRREAEFHKSLEFIGYSGLQVEAMVDERHIYDVLINDSENGGIARTRFLDSAVRRLSDRFSLHKPDYILVNDFAGGHIIHDVVNFATVQAVKNMRGYRPRVFEYWQAFMQEHVPSSEIPPICDESEVELWKGKATQIVGQLGFDTQGRIMGRDIPHTNVRHGHAFYTLFDVLHTMYAKSKIYQTQERSLRRLGELSEIISLDAPAFREIDIDALDYTKRPSHGVLYEKCGWRLRGLERLPTFDDFTRLIQNV
jgi:LmbE family N-acetylglucosaminyl deacetylase